MSTHGRETFPRSVTHSGRCPEKQGEGRLPPGLLCLRPQLQASSFAGAAGWRAEGLSPELSARGDSRLWSSPPRPPALRCLGTRRPAAPSALSEASPSSGPALTCPRGRSLGSPPATSCSRPLFCSGLGQRLCPPRGGRPSPSGTKAPPCEQALPPHPPAFHECPVWS